MELKVLVVVLWSCSIPVQSSVIQRKYWYHPEPKSWKEAQQFCQEAFEGDLATVVTDADLMDLDLNMHYGWIGLRKTSSVWGWVITEEQYKTSTTNGRDVNLIIKGQEPGKDCGKFQYSNTEVFAANCDQKHFVLCEDGAHVKYFFSETVSWRDGLTLCKNEAKVYMDTGGGSFNYEQQQDFPVWIGLNCTDPALNPDPGSGLCAAVSSKSKTMTERECSKSFPFICYRNNLVLLKEELTWENALEACRNLKNVYNHTSFNLLSLEEKDLEYVHSYTKGATTSKVWVGLRFLAGSWFWADNVTDTAPSSLFSNSSSCPGFRLGCGALVVNTSSASDPVIEPTDCSEKLNVLCYGSGPQN